MLLRAERDRKGNGRVYRVRFTATNAFGGSCSGVVIVEAPVKPRTPSIDDGASFDSLIP